MHTPWAHMDGGDGIALVQVGGNRTEIFIRGVQQAVPLGLWSDLGASILGEQRWASVYAAAQAFENSTACSRTLKRRLPLDGKSTLC